MAEAVRRAGMGVATGLYSEVHHPAAGRTGRLTASRASTPGCTSSASPVSRSPRPREAGCQARPWPPAPPPPARRQRSGASTSARWCWRRGRAPVRAGAVLTRVGQDMSAAGEYTAGSSRTRTVSHGGPPGGEAGPPGRAACRRTSAGQPVVLRACLVVVQLRPSGPTRHRGVARVRLRRPARQDVQSRRDVDAFRPECQRELPTSALYDR